MDHQHHHRNGASNSLGHGTSESSSLYTMKESSVTKLPSINNNQLPHKSIASTLINHHQPQTSTLIMMSTNGENNHHHQSHTVSSPSSSPTKKSHSNTSSPSHSKSDGYSYRILCLFFFS